MKKIQVKDLFSSELFESLPRLHTERLTLRCAKMGDTADLYDICRDPAVARYVLWDAHTSPSITRNYIRFLQRQYRQGEPPTFVIVFEPEKKVVGTISFIWIQQENRSAEVGYSLHHHYWNRGIATEALKAILKYGFQELELNRIEAQHDVANPASGRVMEKAGMQREGILRERIYNKGKYVDVMLYSILRRDYRQ